VKEEEFRQVIESQCIRKGSFIACKTAHSVCTGYFLEACYKTSQGGFINLSGTRKLGQGRSEEDWYDHTYSVPLTRIKKVEVLEPPFNLEGEHERGQMRLEICDG